MGVTAQRVKLGLIDAIIPEPLGRAHLHAEEMASRLKQQLLSDVKSLEGLSKSERLDQLQKTDVVWVLLSIMFNDALYERFLKVINRLSLRPGQQMLLP